MQYAINCFIFLCFSKLQSDSLRDAIASITNDSREKQRKFVETIELQIGLKNYDPQKDKRFSGSVKLPHIPRPKMKVCMLGDAQHVEEVCYASIISSCVFFGVNLLGTQEFNYLLL
jgi:ribosomal protein L1